MSAFLNQQIASQRAATAGPFSCLFYSSISHCSNELYGIVERTSGHFSLLGFIRKSQSTHVYPFGKVYNGFVLLS